MLPKMGNFKKLFFNRDFILIFLLIHQYNTQPFHLDSFFRTVYLCRRLVDNCLVIIKQIPVEDMTLDERQSAINEVKVLSVLKYPNIIGYYDSFYEDKALMIVMEYAEGKSLNIPR